MSIDFIRKLPVPEEIKKRFPASERVKRIKESRDREIADVFTGRSDRFIVIVGPCSADKPEPVLDYVGRLARLNEQVRHAGVEPKPVFTGIFPPILRQPLLTYVSMPAFGFLVLTKICSVKTAAHPTANEFEVILVS